MYPREDAHQTQRHSTKTWISWCPCVKGESRREMCEDQLLDVLSTSARTRLLFCTPETLIWAGAFVSARRGFHPIENIQSMKLTSIKLEYQLVSWQRHPGDQTRRVPSPSARQSHRSVHVFSISFDPKRGNERERIRQG